MQLKLSLHFISFQLDVNTHRVQGMYLESEQTMKQNGGQLKQKHSSSSSEINLNPQQQSMKCKKNSPAQIQNPEVLENYAELSDLFETNSNETKTI